MPLLARNKFRRYILRNRQPRRYCLSKSFDGKQLTGECTSCEIRYGEQTRFKLWSLDSAIPNYHNQVTPGCSYLQEEVCSLRYVAHHHKLQNTAITPALNSFSIHVCVPCEMKLPVLRSSFKVGYFQNIVLRTERTAGKRQLHCFSNLNKSIKQIIKPIKIRHAINSY